MKQKIAGYNRMTDVCSDWMHSRCFDQDCQMGDKKHPSIQQSFKRQDMFSFQVVLGPQLKQLYSHYISNAKIFEKMHTLAPRCSLMYSKVYRCHMETPLKPVFDAVMKNARKFCYINPSIATLTLQGDPNARDIIEGATFLHGIREIDARFSNPEVMDEIVDPVVQESRPLILEVKPKMILAAKPTVFCSRMTCKQRIFLPSNRALIGCGHVMCKLCLMERVNQRSPAKSRYAYNRVCDECGERFHEVYIPDREGVYQRLQEPGIANNWDILGQL